MRIYKQNSSASSAAFLTIFGCRFASWLPRAAMAMAVSFVQLAKRALVTLILALAQQYGVQTSAAQKRMWWRQCIAKWSKVCIPTEAMLRMHSRCR